MEHQRYDYDLTPQSVVFDLGGYEGKFARLIHERYGCTVHVFEPVREFYDAIAIANAGIPDVRVYPLAIGGEDRIDRISIRNDSSSVHLPGERSEAITFRSLKRVMEELLVGAIDLIKINVEGCEYEILEHALDAGLVPRLRDIQVQFHDLFPDAAYRRDAIRARLSLTHHLTYDYPFVWENWRRNDA